VAELDELPLRARLFLKVYPWRRVDPTPWAPLRRPLRECRVAIISSAGFAPAGQPPFNQDERGGDPTFRIVDAETQVSLLGESHRSWAFDHSGIQADPNLGFPIDRIRELAAEGAIGAVAPRHLSCMGSQTVTRRLVSQTAPDAVHTLVRDEVDLALLVPV
jgi:D-proline reductase (dithiol) PrdB